MSEAQIRLECLKLAVAMGAGTDAAKVAAQLLSFIKGDQ